MTKTILSAAIRNNLVNPEEICKGAGDDLEILLYLGDRWSQGNVSINQCLFAFEEVKARRKAVGAAKLKRMNDAITQESASFLTK